MDKQRKKNYAWLMQCFKAKEKGFQGEGVLDFDLHQFESKCSKKDKKIGPKVNII